MNDCITTGKSGVVLALRPREAAKALGISERTLWAWTQAGEVPHVRRGRTVLYPTKELETWLASAAASEKQAEGSA